MRVTLSTVKNSKKKHFSSSLDSRRELKKTIFLATRKPGLTIRPVVF